MDYYSMEIPPPDSVESFCQSGDTELLADLYLPATGTGNGACVVLIHGGGWSAGKREDFLWHAYRLSTHGYVACTVDYRLISTATFPAALQDCQAAIRWIRRNAQRFAINPQKIGVLGSSAGGHLAACLGVFETPEETVSSKVACVVDIHGIHDFPASMSQGGEVKTLCEAFIGGPLVSCRDQWLAASPALHVDATSAPMFLVHNPDDTIVPYAQSVQFALQLMQAGCAVSFMPCPASSHGFVYKPSRPGTQLVWPHIVSWFDRHLLEKPAFDKPQPISHLLSLK